MNLYLINYGLTLRPWSKGKRLVWDATCVDTLCKSYLIDISHSWGGGRQSREEEGLQFAKPIHILSFCGRDPRTFGEEALQLVSELGGRLRSTTGDAREKTWHIQRISVAIQRGNAASVLATIPLSFKTIDDFNSV